MPRFGNSGGAAVLLDRGSLGGIAMAGGTPRGVEAGVVVHGGCHRLGVIA